MNEIIEKTNITPELIKSLGNVIIDLPYDKIALLGLIYLANLALQKCNISVFCKDTKIEVTPA